MSFVILLVVLTISIWFTAKVMPNAEIDGFASAIPAAIVLSIFNAILKPILVVLTIPVTILTLGLFLFVINGLIIWWVSKMFSGFSISSFGGAIVFGLVLSVVESVLFTLIG